MENGLGLVWLETSTERLCSEIKAMLTDEEYFEIYNEPRK